MPDIRSFFEDVGYEVLSISTNRKGEVIVRTERGEFNVGKKIFPAEFEDTQVQKILAELTPSF